MPRKVIFLGNIHTDMRCYNILDNLSSSAMGKDLIYCIEQDSKDTLENVIARQKEKLKNLNQNYRDFLKTNNIDISNEDTTSFQELFLCEDIQKFTNTEQVKKIFASNRLMSMLNPLLGCARTVRWAYATLMRCELLHERGLQVEMFENAQHSTQGNMADPKVLLEAVSNFSNRENYLVNTTIPHLLNKHKDKNLIIIIGAVHLSAIKNLISQDGSKEYDSHYYVATPINRATSVFGTIDEIDKANKKIQKFKDQGFELINNAEKIFANICNTQATVNSEAKISEIGFQGSRSAQTKTTSLSSINPNLELVKTDKFSVWCLR